MVTILKKTIMHTLVSSGQIGIGLRKQSSDQITVCQVQSQVSGVKGHIGDPTACLVGVR